MKLQTPVLVKQGGRQLDDPPWSVTSISCRILHLAQRLARSVDQIFEPATQLGAAQRRGILQPAGGSIVVQQVEPQKQLLHPFGAVVAANPLRAGQLKYTHGSTS